MKTILFFAALLALVPFAHATTNVSVTLDVGIEASIAPQVHQCTVSVPLGANGTVVLDAAIAAKCISSYHLQHYSFGDFVDCIDGVCGQDAIVEGTFWAMFLNGACTSYGVTDYSAADGDVLSFEYSDYYTACSA
jgi:hypothetical protein